MSRKNKVAFIQNEEPAFIKQFKERIGYKEGPNVDTKRAEVEYDSDDEGREIEDEKPTVVVLKPGDITQEEADKILKEVEEPAHKIGDKITFKKPLKRANESDETESDGKDNVKAAKKDKKKEKKKEKEKKKSSLLSFDDEEEEDG